MRRRSLLAVVALAAAGVIAPVLPVDAQPVPVTPTTLSLPVPSVTSSPTDATAAPRSAPGARSLVARLTRTGVDFDVAGLTFSGARPVGLLIEARTHTPAGWGAWHVLETLGDSGPDPDSAEADRAVEGTEPLVAPGSDGIEVRALSSTGQAPPDLRARLVEGGRSDADATMGLRPGAAVASVTSPAIIRRAQWGADESLRPCDPDPLAGYKAGVVHHTAGSNSYSSDQVPSVLRGILAYHTVSLGWCDIGYHLLVDRFGRTYEGRTGSVTGAVLGAHAGGFNSETFGVSVIGDFTSAPFPAAVVTAVQKVLAWQADRWAFDPSAAVVLTSRGSSRHPEGTVVTLPRVVGHRDLSLTACPGDAAYPQVPTIRSGAAAIWRAGQYVAAPARYTAVTPKRVLDSRSGTGAPTGAIAGGRTLGLTVPGLPSNATSVTLNVTATGATASTFVSVFPGGQARRSASNLNVATGRTVATQVTVGLGPGASVSLHNASGSVHLIADLVGYSTPTASLGYLPTSPRRVVDSRTGLGLRSILTAGTAVSVALPNLPTATRAVTLNVTALGATRATHVSVYPGGAARPNASSLNLVPGDTVANLVTVPVGTGNTVTFYSGSADVHLVADLAGAHSTTAGNRLAVLSPRRVMDTRTGFYAPQARVAPKTPLTLTVPGVPSGARAVVLTVTGVRPDIATYLTAFPTGTTAPTASNLNLPAGAIVSNQVVVPLGAGSIDLLSGSANLDLVVDLHGYYAP